MGLTRNDEFRILAVFAAGSLTLGHLLSRILASTGLAVPLSVGIYALGYLSALLHIRAIRIEGYMLDQCRDTIEARLDELTDPYWPGAGE